MHIFGRTVTEFRGAYTPLAVVWIVAGCAGVTPPDTGYAPSAAARAAPYPGLLDRTALAAALVPAGDTYLVAENAAADIAARADALAARAAGARPVLTPEERTRLLEAGD